jgi:hypothetical protein
MVQEVLLSQGDKLKAQSPGPEIPADFGCKILRAGETVMIPDKKVTRFPCGLLPCIKRHLFENGGKAAFKASLSLAERWVSLNEESL